MGIEVEKMAEPFIIKYDSLLNDLSLFQILTGFEMVINDDDFERCDKYFSDMLKCDGET